MKTPAPSRRDFATKSEAMAFARLIRRACKSVQILPAYVTVTGEGRDWYVLFTR